MHASARRADLDAHIILTGSLDEWGSFWHASALRASTDARILLCALDHALFSVSRNVHVIL